MIRSLLHALTAAALVLYPFYVWWLASTDQLMHVAWPLCALLIAQTVVFGWRHPRTVFALITASLLVIMIAAGEGETGVLYYPVWMNFALLIIFAWSYRFPPAVITRIAIAMEGPLDKAGETYTRKVTLVWCGFFLLNGSLAAGTVWWGDIDLWTLYNGFIAYVLMGLLLLGEWSIRRVIRRE